MGSSVHEDSTEVLDRLIQDARDRLGAGDEDPVLAALRRHGVQPEPDDTPQI